jgi:L-fuconolactonase
MPDVSTDPGRVDAHHHLWDPATRNHAWLDDPGLAPIRRAFTLADLAAVAEPAGVRATVLVQALDEAAETADLLRIAATSDLIAGVVGWVDLTAADVADRLAAASEGPGGAKLVGIRHGVQGEPDPDWLDRPDVRCGIAAVGTAGLAYDLLTLAHQLPAAIRVVRALPEVSFVLDHLSKPPIAAGEREPWTGDIRALAGLPNVVCKLSGLVTEADHAQWTVADLDPYAATVLDAFGPDRIMFGSDWPVCLLAASYPQVVDTADALTRGLDGRESGAVRGGTARRVYRLG